MTDKEMALQIGNEIIRLQSRIDALEALFSKYMINDPNGGKHQIPVREGLVQIESEEIHHELIRARSERLQEAVDASEDESHLFQALWKIYCLPAK